MESSIYVGNVSTGTRYRLGDAGAGDRAWGRVLPATGLLLAASAEEEPPRAGPQLRDGRPGATIIHKVPRPCWPCGGQVSWDMYGTANTAVAQVSWLADAPTNDPEEGRNDAKVSSVL